MSQPKKKEIGEGDRESARRYNEDTREFVNEKYDEEDARKARGTAKEGANLTNAEKEARSRAKEFDPEVSRDYDDPAGKR